MNREMGLYLKQPPFEERGEPAFFGNSFRALMPNGASFRLALFSCFDFVFLLIEAVLYAYAAAVRRNPGSAVSVLPVAVPVGSSAVPVGAVVPIKIIIVPIVCPVLIIGNGIIIAVRKV